MRVFGISVFTCMSDGGLCLASYHPTHSGTWYWSVSLCRNRLQTSSWKETRRTGQWHDYYALPGGWLLIVSYQDYHKDTAALRAHAATLAADEGNG